MNRQIGLSIITFFIIAFGLTFIFSKLSPIIFYSIDVKDILCGFGPLLSGLICYKLFKTPTSYSVSGTQPLKAWSIVLLAIITFIITNYKNGLTFNILFALTQIIYCFGEEFGWRHYLQSATNKLSKWLQPFIIGLVWFCWHFSWLQDPVKAMTGKNIHTPIGFIILFAIIALSVISFLLGQVINKTKSLHLPVILHFAVKTNTSTIAITFILVILAVLSWNKLSFSFRKRI